jgi:hypothetical protein
MICRMSTSMRSYGMGAATLLAVVFALATPAAAKSYSAERFDSVVRVLPDGTLEVTETTRYRFEDGTFREVFREIPFRNTDGVEVIEAGMQGRTLPFGEETGTAEVRRRSSRVRVTWRFAPVESVAREFTLRYRVRGAIRRANGEDLLVWRGLPGEHQYRIDASSLRFELPVAPAAAPDVRTRRVSTHAVQVAGHRVEIEASAVGKNGWVETSLRFPEGAVSTGAPAWQQHAAEVGAQAASWMIVAAAIAAAGVVLLVAWRQGYDRPPGDLDLRGAVPLDPPDAGSATLGGVLAGNGRATLEHAMAAVFALAERGEVEIEGKPRGTFSQRDFALTRRGGSTPLTAYERAALETIFKGPPAQGQAVTLSQARSRLMRKFRPFSAAIAAELRGAGLLDAGRKTVRDRYNTAGVAFLVLAAVAVAPAALLTSRSGGWPFLIPAAIAVVGLFSFIFAATITPLSNEGVRRAARWRQYRRHLRDVAQGRHASAGIAVPKVLPYAVALGLASAWSKYLARHGHPVPRWFRAQPSQDGAAFPALIAAGGAGASSGGSGTSAGAAGGGSAGAS